MLQMKKETIKDIGDNEGLIEFLNKNKIFQSRGCVTQPPLKFFNRISPSPPFSLFINHNQLKK